MTPLAGRDPTGRDPSRLPSASAACGPDRSGPCGLPSPPAPEAPTLQELVLEPLEVWEEELPYSPEGEVALHTSTWSLPDSACVTRPRRQAGVGPGPGR